MQYTFSWVKLGVEIFIWLISWAILFGFGSLFVQCIKFQKIISTILSSLPYYYFLLLSGYFAVGLLVHSTLGVAHDSITASLLFMQ